MGTNPSAFTGKQMDVSSFSPALSDGEAKARLVDVKKVVGKDTSRHPVETVNWDDAMEFCRRLSAIPAERAARRVYRLPTEVEWEYACRAGTTTPWNCGDDEAGLAEVAWFFGNARAMPHPVGEKKPNAWGLYDMHGNVWQWCADWFNQDYYKQSAPADPSGPPAGSVRVMRGGFFYSYASNCRSASRNSIAPANRNHHHGFRVVAEISVQPSATSSQQPEPQAASPSPYLGPDGKWKLPPSAPPPAVAPFDGKKANEHQAAWAKHLSVPVEATNSIGMKLALIPPGEFEMGSTPEEQAWAMAAGQDVKKEGAYNAFAKEGPRHRAKISRPFYLGMYHVTQAEYEKVMRVNPSTFTAKQMEPSAFNPPLSDGHANSRQADLKRVAGKDASRHPVETVNWEEAMEFCRRLSALPAERAACRVYRLPTEAEWEYACRAGTTSRWYCGDDEAGLAEVAWFFRNAKSMTQPVGEKKPNGWGLCDMHGNVWQWCADRYSAGYYKRSPPSDPTGPSAGSCHVLRGGSWGMRAPLCRSACRNVPLAANRSSAYGFRVVVDVVAKAQPTSAAIDPAFIEEVAPLPAGEQVKRVVAKLKQLNPGYDGTEEHRIENGQVVDLDIKHASVSDLSPVRALAQLKRLQCGGLQLPEGGNAPSPLRDLSPLQGLPLDELTCGLSSVSDLSPLKGVPLKHLSLSATLAADLAPLQGMPLTHLYLCYTPVKDISPLRTLPLTHLLCYRTKVTDLSPLKDTPLEVLRCDFDPSRDTDILRSMKTLQRINGLSVADFWKQVEAGKIPPPKTNMGKEPE